MRYRKLHGTDLEISELGFGTWTLTTGWWGTYTDDEARRMISRALDRGVNYIDTADAYGNGRGESVLAPILAQRRDVVVGTKFGYDFYNNPERPRGQRELPQDMRSEEHTSELQSRGHLVCRLLLEKKKSLTEHH